MKQKIVLIISVLVGVLAFVLTAHYLKSKQAEIEEVKARLYEGARQVAVVVAGHDIPSGTEIKQADLGWRNFPETALPDSVVTYEEANAILNRKTLVEIKADKPILWLYVEGGAPTDKGLADRIKPGMRAISLAVRGAPAVSGMVLPNDRVDVLGTFSFPSKTAAGEMETVTLTVLQDVTVLATGQQLARQPAGGRGRPSTGYNSVTLEVTAREAELLVFAQQVKGSLFLSLRNSSDMSFESDLPEINFEHLEKKLPELNQYRQQNVRHKRGP